MNPVPKEAIDKYKFQLQNFLDKLESAIKRLSFDSWVEITSRFIEQSPYNHRKFGQFPPNLALHSIEFLAIVGRTFGRREANQRDLIKIAHLYHEIENRNPYHKLLLDNPENSEEAIFLFLSDLSQKHFILQGLLSPRRWSRELIIYESLMAQKSIGKIFVQNHGLNFRHWFALTFCLFAGLHKGAYQYNKNDLIIGLSQKLSIHKDSILFFVDTLSISLEQIRESYLSTRKAMGAYNKIPCFYEFHIPSVFLDKPFIALDPDRFWAPYKSIIPHASFKALRTILGNNYPNEYSTDMGKAFEEYIAQLFSLIPRSRVINAKEIKKLLKMKEGQEICDLVVIDTEASYVVECKAVSYDSRLVTLQAISKSNYATKIRSTSDQLTGFISALRTSSINESLFLDLSKPILPLIITYGGISLPNYPYLREKIMKIDPFKLNSISPQIIAAESFEMLINLSIKSGKSIIDIYFTKQKIPYTQSGDWEAYLSSIIREGDIGILDFFRSPFNSFVEEIKECFKPKLGWVQ